MEARVVQEGVETSANELLERPATRESKWIASISERRRARREGGAKGAASVTNTFLPRGQARSRCPFGLAAAGTTRIGSKTQRAVGTRRRRAPTPFAMRRCSRRLALVAALVATLLLVGSVAAGGADWDDDGAVYDSPQEAKMRDAAAKSAADASAERARARMEARQRAYRDAPPMFEWLYEGVGIAVVLAFVINFLAGDATNRRMARDFERAFLSDRAAGVFHREFAEVGAPGARGPSRGSLLSREAPHEYTLYATGRRFVDAVTVTLRLKKRNDLYSAAYDLLRPGELDPDRVVVECAMREGVVQPGTVFAVGDKAAVATLERNAGKRDVARLCGSHAPRDAAGRRTLAVGVTLKAESPELADDILTETALAAALGESAFAGPAGRYLETIHCAEESGPSSDSRSVLRFTFRHPGADAGAEGVAEALGSLFELVPHFIDVVGRVRLTAAQREKANKARTRREEEDFKRDLKSNARDAADARLDAKLAKMTPREKELWREKQAKKQLRKSQGKVVMRRM